MMQGTPKNGAESDTNQVSAVHAMGRRPQAIAYDKQQKQRQQTWPPTAWSSTEQAVAVHHTELPLAEPPHSACAPLH